jgi:replicative DNA helicase
MSDTMPHDDDLERAVLGAAMYDAQAQAEVMHLLTPDAFYGNGHRMIFQAIARLSATRQTADLLATAGALRVAGQLDDVGGPGYLAALVNDVYTTANVEHHAGRLNELASRRRLIRSAMEMIAGAQDERRRLGEVIEAAERGVSGAAGFDAGRDIRRLSDVMSKAYQDIERRQSGEDDGRFISFGYPDLDATAVGMSPGEMVLLAARPAMGKTALAAGIAAAVAGAQGRPVMLFSLEMTSESIARRLMATNAKVNGMAMQMTGAMRDGDWDKLAKAMGRMGDWPLYIDDNGEVTSQQMRAKCRRVQREAGQLGLIIVDHIGLMEPDGKAENRTQEMSRISRGIKLMAKEFDCPVLVLSQLNRQVEQRTNKRPMLSDLRESGSLEQDADKVLFVYRDAYYDPESKEGDTAEVIVAKHRDGTTGTVKLFYSKATAAFETLGFDNDPAQVDHRAAATAQARPYDFLNSPEPLTQTYGASA